MIRTVGAMVGTSEEAFRLVCTLETRLADARNRAEQLPKRLARWLNARGVEAHVIHPSSVAVSREHRRAKTDRLDTELLKRGFLGWLRGERGHCSMARVPTIAEEDAKRPNRERECLVGERTRIVNRMKATLAGAKDDRRDGHVLADSLRTDRRAFRRLENALYHWARLATQHDALSRRRYAALRRRGHSHGRALRTVADRLLSVACTLLEQQTLFDPTYEVRDAASA